LKETLDLEELRGGHKSRETCFVVSFLRRGILEKIVLFSLFLMIGVVKGHGRFGI